MQFLITSSRFLKDGYPDVNKTGCVIPFGNDLLHTTVTLFAGLTINNVNVLLTLLYFYIKNIDALGSGHIGSGSKKWPVSPFPWTCNFCSAKCLTVKNEYF